MSQLLQREVQVLDAAAAVRYRAALAEVLVDCVAGGAGVSFMAGFDQAHGEEGADRALAGGAGAHKSIVSGRSS